MWITYGCNLQKNCPSKQSPNGWKFAQSGHPDQKLQRPREKAAEAATYFYNQYKSIKRCVKRRCCFGRSQTEGPCMYVPGWPDEFVKKAPKM
jgi:hypothetical protein